MNKKVLTLCASFLLAGGLTSSALAETFGDVAQKFKDGDYVEGQYFYVKTNNYGDGSATAGDGNGHLDVNVEGSYYSHEENRSTWWRLEAVKTTVNGTEEIIGYKLINALTNKPYTVTVGDKTYDTFNAAAQKTLEFIGADGDVVGYYNGTTTSIATTNTIVYSLKAVEPEKLTASEINKVNNDYFGLQFGYINKDGDYVNYEGLQGVDPFVGKLVAKTTEFGEDIQGVSAKIELADDDSYFIYNETKGAYVVLLKEKWSKYNTDLTPASEVGKGHKFALMTAKEIIEDQLKDAEEQTIATWSFKVNMPVVVDYSPLEVVAVQAWTQVGEEEEQKDLEMLISDMDGKDYLNTTLAENKEEDNDLLEAVDPVNTVVRFADTDYIDMSEFYGWAITVKGLQGEGVEGMTIQPNVQNETNLQPSDVWTKADYVSFSRPEAQWIVTVDKTGTLKLTNRETKASVRWNEAFDMLPGDKGTPNTLALRRESGDIYVANLDNKTYRFEIKKVAELGGETLDHYGCYNADETPAGIARDYKVTFTDSFGTTTYVGIDGLGNVLLTRDETKAINFDLVKTQTTDTLNNDGTIAENAKKDVFYIINDIMAKNKDGEWEYTAAGDTLSYFRYKLAYNGEYLKYNEAKKQFELVKEVIDYTDATAPANVANKEIDYGNSTLADNFIVKLKENNKLNVVKVANYEMENILNGKYTATVDGAEKSFVITNLGIDPAESADAEDLMFVVEGKDDAAWPNNQEGEKLLLNGEMMFFDFNNAEVQKQQNIYAWNANAQLTIAPKEYASYRYFANPDTVEIYRVEYSDEFLFEHGNILGMTYNRDMYNPSLYLDTAFVRNDTKKPTYMLAVAPEFEPNHTYCPLHGIDADCPAEHLTIIPGYTTARYLVSYTDSVAAHAAELKNEFLHEGQYTKLGFVDAVHRVDSVFVPTMSEENKKTVITEGAILPYTFAFRIVNPETQSFYIEAAKLNDEKNPNSGYKSSWMAWINGCPVLTDDITLAEEFNVREGKQAPTANETIEDAASAISVVATDGAVIVKGAEGKNVIVSTILGKVVANETVNSDNETIAAPAGIVVVSIDGESFKVAVK